MEWVVYAIVMIVAGLVSYYAAQRAQKSTQVAPGTVEQPTVNQGDRFGLLFGTREIKNPKVLWMGNTGTSPIQK